MRKNLLLRIPMFVSLTVLMLPDLVQACEVCYWTWLNPGRSYCRPVHDTETGTTGCDTFIDNLGDSFCTEGGSYCSVITVTAGGGGGGGTSGGTGSNPCQTSGFCPAQCFSCSGGLGDGGRPAV